MATLTNPINTQNIVDRFADYVVATANAGIVWHSTNLPFPEFDAALLLTSTGTPIAITGSNINATPITASTIYNTLLAETNRYTRIRTLRATLTITTGPGNATRLASDALDLSNIAHLTAPYTQTVPTPTNNGVAANNVISSGNLESFFTTLRTSYNTARATSVTINVNVCHSSCHSSCHGSRGRR
jgi:hypothetical protein